jgi:hypothetical protein
VTSTSCRPHLCEQNKALAIVVEDSSRSAHGWARRAMDVLTMVIALPMRTISSPHRSCRVYGYLSRAWRYLAVSARVESTVQVGPSRVSRRCLQTGCLSIGGHGEVLDWRGSCHVDALGAKVQQGISGKLRLWMVSSYLHPAASMSK